MSVFTGIRKKICVSYNKINDEETLTQLSYHNNMRAKDYTEYIQLIPPSINKELQITTKLCLNNMKVNGMTDVVLSKPINQLPTNEFIFMILDLFQNCEMMLLAEYIIDCIGYPETEITFERVYEDKYRALYNFNHKIKVKLRTYFWLQIDGKPIIAVNNMDLDTKNGKNLHLDDHQDYFLQDGYETHSDYYKDLMRELNSDLPFELRGRYLINNLDEIKIVEYGICVLNSPLPKFLVKFIRSKYLSGVDDLGIPLNKFGRERPEIKTCNINPYVHSDILDIKKEIGYWL